jgi:hypothetical protein
MANCGQLQMEMSMLPAGTGGQKRLVSICGEQTETETELVFIGSYYN